MRRFSSSPDDPSRRHARPFIPARPFILTAAFVGLVWMLASAALAQTPDSSATDPTSGTEPARVPEDGQANKTAAEHQTGVDSTAVAIMGWGTLQAQVRWRRTSAVRARGKDASDEGVSVGGLLVDETRTTIGRDFYSLFYTRWETPDGVKNVTVRVQEQPLPNLGTRVLIEVQGTTVYRATLQPDVSVIRRAARAALARTMRYLKERYEPRDSY